MIGPVLAMKAHRYELGSDPAALALGAERPWPSASGLEHALVEVVKVTDAASARPDEQGIKAAPKRAPKRSRGGLEHDEHEHGPGLQGPNVGYWQATGSTRAAAKRAKRP
jgi:hypothetical protein